MNAHGYFVLGSFINDNAQIWTFSGEGIKDLKLRLNSDWTDKLRHHSREGPFLTPAPQ